MEQQITEHSTGHSFIIKILGACTCQCKRVMPHLNTCVRSALQFNRERLVPIAHKSSRFIGSELRKIHQRENWFKRCCSTLVENAAGLAMALLAGKIVQNTVEVEQFSNLWGLLATRTVVSESTYEILNFGIEFIIALIVFTLTEHCIEEYHQRRKSADEPEATVSDREAKE